VIGVFCETEMNHDWWARWPTSVPGNTNMITEPLATTKEICASIRAEVRICSGIVTADSEPAWMRPIVVGVSAMMEQPYPFGVPSAQPWAALRFESERQSTILSTTQDMKSICCCKVATDGAVSSPYEKGKSYWIEKQVVVGGDIWREDSDRPQMLPGAGFARENVFPMLRVGETECLIMLVLPWDFKVEPLFKEAKRIARVRKPDVTKGGMAGVIRGDRAEIRRIIQEWMYARLIELSVE